MSFVLQTVAGILRNSPTHSPHRRSSCGCETHPQRCCHKTDRHTSFAATSSFECMNDDLDDWHRYDWPTTSKQWVSPKTKQKKTHTLQTKQKKSIKHLNIFRFVVVFILIFTYFRNFSFWFWILSVSLWSLTWVMTISTHTANAQIIDRFPGTIKSKTKQTWGIKKKNLWNSQ